MKRLLILVIAMAMCGAMYAEHLKFMKIPIDGTLPEFEKELMSKGFTPIADDSRNSDVEKWYQGEWYGENVNLAVFTSEISKKVFSVALYFNEISGKDLVNKKTKKIGNVIKLTNLVTDVIEKDNAIAYKLKDDIGLISFLNDDGILKLYYFDTENTKLSDKEEGK